MLTPEERKARSDARKQARKDAKEAARIEAEKNQRHVKSLTISIEWKSSRTWGSNPHATAEVRFLKPIDNGGTFERSIEYTCSGCGYDKESTVIANVFNAYLKYKLYETHEGKVPYGVRLGDRKCYDGGIGTSCYFDIAKYIGGEFKKIASGKTFDVYCYTDNEKGE